MEYKKRRREEGEEEEIEVGLVVEQEEEDEVLPGFRFHPTDEELVCFYLRRKVDKKRLSIEIIKEIDIYKYDPWDLPKTSSGGGEKEWYFFCLRGRKYKNSIRPNRVTSSGFWKATGIDRPIYSGTGTACTGDCIGLKKSLVYYRGSAGKGTKTDWMMHEFRLPPDEKTNDNTPPSMQEAEVWTICRIFKRNATYKKTTHEITTHEITSKKIKTQEQYYSSSNESSFESNSGDVEYNNCFNYPTPNNNYINSLPDQGNELMSSSYNNYNYSEENNYQSFQGQWNNNNYNTNNPTVQNPLMGFNPTVTMNPVMDEYYFKDGCWDEIDRMMEFMPQSVACDYM